MDCHHGPLLIFCQSARLAATSVPFGQSNLELKDIEKVNDLCSQEDWRR